MLRRKCLSKSTTNTFGKRVSCQGPWGKGILFPFLVALQDGSTITALKLASDVLYDRRPLGSVTVKRDEEEEPLGRTQIKKLERYDNQFQQMMAPFHAASTGRVQKRHPADVEDKTQGTPLGKEEASSHQVVLVKEQQPESTTKPDVRPKEIALTTPASIPAVMEPTLQELPVPRALQAFFWWVNAMMRYIPEGTQIQAVNATKSTICDMSSETMVNTAVPPGMEAGFAQPVMATAAPPPEDKDTHMVQFMDESEGGGEPQATAVQ